MLSENLKKALRFYYLTDENAPACPPIRQVEIAIQAGAGMIQYRHKSFHSGLFEEVTAIRNLCKCNQVPFLVNDNILLAKAVGADGVHLGQDDDKPALARSILGPEAVIGISVSNLQELAVTDLFSCDYIGTGPVFPTRTKKDAKAVCGLSGLQRVQKKSSLAVVAIGGIDDTNAGSCFQHGAAGVAVISFISRAKDPADSAGRLAAVCGCAPTKIVASGWNDEFALIDKLLAQTPADLPGTPFVKIPPGDDACLLRSLKNPVISTDTQREGVHFRFGWQTPDEVGRKAVEVTFSDLAASYATPVCLFVNLTLPAHVPEQMVETLYRGIKMSLSKYHCELGGGNISRGQELSVDLFAIGTGADVLYPSRAAAQTGYGLYCTGPLGLARAGMDALERKDASEKTLIEKFKFPCARFDAAAVLARNNVACVIDISDGLMGDATHIAKASNLTIAFDIQSGDCHPALVDYCQKYKLSPENMVLAGGEDYELLFACPPDMFDIVKEDLPDAFQVGRCLPFKGRYLLNLPDGIVSFQHGHLKVAPGD